MRRKFTHYGTLLILMLCIWGHVSEIFDHWDNTFQTGHDIEYSTVIVALVAGAVISFVRLAAVVVRTFSIRSHQLLFFGSDFLDTYGRTAFISHSPPAPLRI